MAARRRTRRAPCSRLERSSGCRTTSHSPSSTGSSTAGALPRAPTTFPTHADLAFPSSMNPRLATPDWRPRFIDYLYLGVHQRDCLQPDRRHAACAMGQDRDGGAVARLARDPRTRHRTGRERVHLGVPDVSRRCHAKLRPCSTQDRAPQGRGAAARRMRGERHAGSIPAASIICSTGIVLSGCCAYCRWARR